MQKGLQSFIERMAAAETLNDLHSLIPDLRDLFEVEHLVYHSVNSTGQQYGMLTYSQDWVDRYLDQDYARIDPVVQGCFRRFHPVDWKALDWSARAQRDFLGEAVDAGVGRQGFSVPIRGPNGQFALFTASDRRRDDAWERYTGAHVQDLILIAHYINQRALEIERGSDEIVARNLSPREVDVLTLLATGLSRAQAAERLSISEHTLRVYVESARYKLQAANTVHAVARAMSEGRIVI